MMTQATEMLTDFYQWLVGEDIIRDHSSNVEEDVQRYLHKPDEVYEGWGNEGPTGEVDGDALASAGWGTSEDYGGERELDEY